MHLTTANPLRLILTAALAIAALLAIAPAASHAAKANFGADLNAGPITPVATKQACSSMPSSGCTRVPEYYGMPPHAGMLPSAPHNGTIKKIKLMSANPGKLKVQIAEHDFMGNARIVASGPRLKYQGTGGIEKFKVHIPVKKFQWVAIKAKKAGTLACDPGQGFPSEQQYQPTLKVGGPLTASSASSECTHLVGARMKY